MYIEMLFFQADYCVDTSLVGVVMNGVSHMQGVRNKAEFAISLIRGLGGNLNEGTRESFAKEVFAWTHEMPPDPRRPLDTYYDGSTGRLMAYNMDVSFCMIQIAHCLAQVWDFSLKIQGT
jgi:dynein heavy chain 2